MTTSPATARRWPRCASKRRRSRAKPSLPTAGSRPSPPSGPPGTNARTSAAAQIATIGQRTEEAKAERTELANAPEKFATQRQALIGEIETATAARRAAADRLAEAETELAEADKAARAALEAVGEARAEAARAEERRDGAKRRLADIEHEIREALDVEPDGAAEIAELKAGAELPEIAEVEAQARPHPRASASGSARSICSPSRNCSEVEAQHGKLTGERDDLVEAIRRLRQGIHSLNHEARERLLASFATVNENFKKLFTELFGGGTAELQLIESDDPLEAGLEIMAKPPGKKPATLSLLSGGEQALTALALIFAVFLTNPAPICVLDEVDAPLDDYNVERFCDLLDEMTRSTDTRFIIITHNPITMARMNRLYGVTMAERGVSQLVSVDLEGAVKLREALNCTSVPLEFAAKISANAPSVISELEQPLRIGAADLEPVVLADRAGIEPIGGVIDILERPVGREHDPVGAELEHGGEQRRRVEIARRRDVEIFAEIVAHRPLRRIAVAVRDPGVGVVDAPERERQILADDGRG